MKNQTHHPPVSHRNNGTGVATHQPKAKAVSHFLRNFSPLKHSKQHHPNTTTAATPPPPAQLLSPSSTGYNDNDDIHHEYSSDSYENDTTDNHEVVDDSASISSLRLGIRPTHYSVPDHYSCVSAAVLNPLIATAAVAASAASQTEPSRSALSVVPPVTDALYSHEWTQDTSTATNTSLESICESEIESPSSSVGSMSPHRKVRWGNSSSHSQQHHRMQTEEAKRKAQDIVQKARVKSSSSTAALPTTTITPTTSAATASTTAPPSTSTSTTTTSLSSSLRTGKHASSVTIFLLLLEPKTKAFELIQLIYPRKHTKLSDLLRMIPQNATEPALAHQHYTGITRPRRRATPCTDLSRLASHSITATTETAGFGNGEIMVAIPADASPAVMVGLAKQILANTRIQKLLSQKHRRKQSRSGGGGGGSPRRSKTSSSGDSNAATSSSTTENKPSPGLSEYCQAELQRTVQQAVSTTTTSSCAATHPKPPSTPTPPDETKVDDDENDGDTVDDCHDDSIFQTPQATIKRMPTSPSPPDLMPEDETTTELTEDGDDSPVPESPHEVEFPKDLLDAYLSKEALMRMCEKRSVDPTDSLTDDDDGSFTSSFHSWRFSLDDSLSRHDPASQLMFSATAASSPSMSASVPPRRRKRLLKLLRRLSVVAFGASVVRFRCADVAGTHALVDGGMMYGTAAASNHLGWTGLCHCLLCLLALTQWQRVWEHPECLLQLATQLYETVVALSSRGNGAVIHHPQGRPYPGQGRHPHGRTSHAPPGSKPASTDSHSSSATPVLNFR